MSGVYIELGAYVPRSAPEVTTAQLTGYLTEHTDLDMAWASPGRGEGAAHDGKPSGVLTFVGARQKYTVEGLNDAAAALSEARPDAVVHCRQEWSEEEVGGEETTYQAGKPVARRSLSWHSIPLDRA